MTLFNSKPDTLDGFEAFWMLFPRDRRRAGRKAGKKHCKAFWESQKLWKIKSQVIAALKEDLKDIDRGAYSLGDDQMYYFSGIQPWLNQGKYDRDISKTDESNSKLRSRVIETSHKAMTSEEKEQLKPHFRRLAKIVEKP